MMVKCAYVARRHLYFDENGLFHISDPRKEKQFHDARCFMQKYLDRTCFRYLVFAIRPKGKPTNEIKHLPKPLLFKTADAFKLYVIRNQPNEVYYVEKGKG